MSGAGRGLAWLLLGSSALVSGCSAEENAEAETVVRSYCEAVIVAYRSLDSEAVRPLTTDKEWRKLVVLIDLKRANRLVLESTLEELEVTAVGHPSPGVMTVGTTERWRYFDRPLDVGRPVGSELVVEMDLEYSFVERDGAWLMDQARTLRHDYLEPEGVALDPHDAHVSTESGESP